MISILKVFGLAVLLPLSASAQNAAQNPVDAKGGVPKTGRVLITQMSGPEADRVESGIDAVADQIEDSILAKRTHVGIQVFEGFPFGTSVQVQKGPYHLTLEAALYPQGIVAPTLISQKFVPISEASARYAVDRKKYVEVGLAYLQASDSAFASIRRLAKLGYSVQVWIPFNRQHDAIDETAMFIRVTGNNKVNPLNPTFIKVGFNFPLTAKR